MNAVVINKSPAGEIPLFLGLHLDMRKHPCLLPALLPDSEEFVSQTLPGFSLTGNLAQLLVQRIVASAPVNILRCFREKECHELLEISGQYFFPRAVIIIMLSHFDILPSGTYLKLREFLVSEM